MERGKLEQARKLVEQKYAASGNDVKMSRRLNLLADLLNMVGAADIWEYRRAARGFAGHFGEYAYWVAAEMGKEYEEKRQDGLSLYWWALVRQAREEGKLPVWEGIRIVQERVW